MTSKVLPEDIPTVDAVIGAFDSPEALDSLLAMLGHTFPDFEPEAVQEIAMVLKYVYITGVFAEVRALTGHTATEIRDHLVQAWEVIYWMQHNTGEA